MVGQLPAGNSGDGDGGGDGGEVGGGGGGGGGGVQLALANYSGLGGEFS